VNFTIYTALSLEALANSEAEHSFQHCCRIRGSGDARSRVQRYQSSQELESKIVLRKEGIAQKIT
jgi:hypothetical protein